MPIIMPPQHHDSLPSMSSTSENTARMEHYRSATGQPAFSPSPGRTGTTPARRVSLDDSNDEEECRAAEEWLSRGSSSSSPSSSRASPPPLTHEAVHCFGERNSPVTSETARSSLSSPGKTSLRERLQRRLRQEDPRVLHPVETWFALTKFVPPPPPPLSPEMSNPKSECSDFSLMDVSQDEEEQDDCRQEEKYDSYCQEERHYDTPPSTTDTPTRTRDAVVQIMKALQEDESNDKKAQAHASLVRLSRQVRYGRRGQVPIKANAIKLHIYDLLPTETIMQLAWGCEFPIGQCFTAVNDGLHALGTGAYHCGIEVRVLYIVWNVYTVRTISHFTCTLAQINGIEYAYGANEMEGTTGVFSCIPKHSPGFEYRTSLDFGKRPLIKSSWTRVDDESLCLPRSGDVY